jgi:hypothetical protein
MTCSAPLWTLWLIQADVLLPHRYSQGRITMTKKELRKLITDALDMGASNALVAKLSNDSQGALKVSSHLQTDIRVSVKRHGAR